MTMTMTMIMTTNTAKGLPARRTITRRRTRTAILTATRMERLPKR